MRHITWWLLWGCLAGCAAEGAPTAWCGSTAPDDPNAAAERCHATARECASAGDHGCAEYPYWCFDFGPAVERDCFTGVRGEADCALAAIYHRAAGDPVPTCARFADDP